MSEINESTLINTFEVILLCDFNVPIVAVSSTVLAGDENELATPTPDYVEP